MRFSMRFFSDNAAPVHPAVMQAMADANQIDTAYDGDQYSARLDGAFSELFGRDVAVLWVATGTSANCLGLASLVQPHQGVICHREAHIEVDECGAPGFYTAGAKLMLIEGDGAKVSPTTVTATLDALRNDVHQVQAAAVSITNATEYGMVFAPAEVAALGALCRERKLGLHMDGARFANAVAYLGCTPADVTINAQRAIAASALGICNPRDGFLRHNCWRCLKVICGCTMRAPPMRRRRSFRRPRANACYTLCKPMSFSCD
jgi:threonine aldolase